MTDRKIMTDTPLRTGPRRARSMTASEFASVVPLVAISQQRIEAARLVLVEGMTYAEAANHIGLGWTRQAVNDCIQHVWKQFQKYQESRSANAEVPSGWEQVTLTAPKELIANFYKQIADAALNAPAGKPAPKKKNKPVKPQA